MRLRVVVIGVPLAAAETAPSIGLRDQASTDAVG
jgi:hypothetical protein